MATDTPVSDMRENEALAKQAVPPERNAAKEDEVSLLDLLIILAARKHVIFWTTAIFAILALIVSLILPKRYTASVTLLPPQQNSSLSNQLAAQLGSMGGMAASFASTTGLVKNPNDMYVSMFR